MSDTHPCPDLPLRRAPLYPRIRAVAIAVTLVLTLAAALAAVSNGASCREGAVSAHSTVMQCRTHGLP